MNAAREAGVTLSDSYEGACATFTGVDLGVGTTERHDLSALVTVAISPDQRRQLLCVESGRWQAPELATRIRETQRRFKSKLRVESNAG